MDQSSADSAGEAAPTAPRTLDEFLNHFLMNHRDDNFLAIKAGNYGIGRDTAANEVVDWTLQYLQWM